MTFHGGTFMAHKISMPLKNSKEDRYNLYAIENINKWQAFITCR